MDKFEAFTALHQQSNPLLIGNVWDVTSAAIFERSGLKAIATSSKALANAVGYEDKENIPFSLLVEIVKRISNHITLPLSVDMEGGYSRTIPGIIENIEQLYELGVVGFNIEDSVMKEKGKLQSVTDFQAIISAVMNHLSRKNMHMFFNARTDAFVHKFPDALTQTITRAKAYEEAGASGIFVPFLDQENDIRSIVSATTLPVNVFYTPQLAPFDTLANWGIRRISMGGSIYSWMNRSMEKTMNDIISSGSFGPLGE